MWQEAPTQLLLETEQVHVWKANVPQFRAQQERLLQYLSRDEKERATKFHFEKDRVTYILGKGLLRVLLGNYLQCTPSSIQFDYNEQSKPFYKNELNLQFNISHSHEMIVFAFTLNNAIGVDIEYNKRLVEIPQIAKRFFSTKETNCLLQLQKNEWLTAFYNCWTRKEAFIKAKGGGLSIPLDQFEVSFISRETAELERIRWDENDVINWKMEAFFSSEDYTAACIVNAKTSFFKYYNCNSLSLFDERLN